MKQYRIKNTKNIPETHYFIYKTHKYPIKFDFFKYSSDFYSKNRHELEMNKGIQLIDTNLEEIIDLSDETIQLFIKYIQNDEIDVNNHNVCALNYLDNKYEVSTLIESTDEYIVNNNKNIIFEILLNHQKDPSINTKTYENIISQHLQMYINDEQLLNLKTPILYRILDNYFNEQEEKEIENDDIFNFLFNYLDKFGRDASVLFSFVNFLNPKIEHLSRLLNEYLKIFDFHFINLSIARALDSLIGEKEELEKKFAPMKKELLKAQSEKNHAEEKINEIEEELKAKRKENEELKHKILLEKENLDEVNDKLRLKKKLKSEEEEADEKMNKKEKELNDLNAEVNGLKKELLMKQEEEGKKLHELEEELNNEKEILERKLQLDQEKTSKFEKELKSLKEGNEDIKEQLPKSDEKINELMRNMNDLIEESKELKRQLRDLQKKNDDKLLITLDELKSTKDANENC
ncbi:hypothetical protein M9Y10_032406 [Tritrichomonas musculus]|uniref:Uncharacterized protein n=1 Tax=Tritrichomonas musculus TaxID=1915356 RepID=A0ABR2GYH7_9EUKA